MRPLRSCMKCYVKRIPYFKNGENLSAKKKKKQPLKFAASLTAAFPKIHSMKKKKSLVK